MFNRNGSEHKHLAGLIACLRQSGNEERREGREGGREGSEKRNMKKGEGSAEKSEIVEWERKERMETRRGNVEEKKGKGGK